MQISSPLYELSSCNEDDEVEQQGRIGSRSKYRSTANCDEPIGLSRSCAIYEYHATADSPARRARNDLETITGSIVRNRCCKSGF